MNDVNQAKTLAEIVMQRAQTMPDFEILTYLADGELDEQPLTYRDFDHRARLIAGYLQQQGLEGERVLLLFPQGLEYMIALFGCFYAGVIAVPAYPPRNNRNMLRIQAILDDTSARAILADRTSVQRMYKMKFDSSHLLLLAYEEALAAQQEWRQRVIPGREIAYLQYTSGSTGSPKGVMITHENVMINAQACRNIYPPDTHCAVNWIPMFHDMGLIYMMSYLIQNAKCYFMSPVHFVQKPLRWLQAVSRYRADYTVAPNFAFDLCCEKINEEQASMLDLSCLRSVLSGSERIQLHTLQRFYDKFRVAGFTLEAFKPGYGLAEGTLAISYVPHNKLPSITPKADPGKSLQTLTSELLPFESPEDYHVSIGPSVEGCQIRIVDLEARQLLPEGQEGEIWISFPGSISDGYWQNEEATREAFHNYLPDDPRTPYLRTGDLGFMLQKELYITGRIKDMIIIRGQNYYPIDIEVAVAQSHPALQLNSSAAFSIDVKGREQLAVVQEVRRAQWRKANPDEVIDAIRRTLSEAFEISPYHIALIFPMSLSKTSSGKVQRQRTKQQLLQGELRIMKEWTYKPTPATKGETETEEQISADWILEWLRQNIAERSKIKLAAIQAQSSFGDFPLESVDAAELSEQLSQPLGFQVEAESFWALPSLQELADYLYEQHKAAKAQ